MEFYKVNKELGDLVNDNVRKLESVFPSVVKDGEVDFEELKDLLGNFKEVDKEKYEMNWVGKKEAKKIALAPLYGKTLKYIEGDGKNEETTENIYIEGDNLEVLKLLQHSYYGKVKMIYIDPPYNTGNDFVYNDKFKESKKNIEVSEGYRDEYGQRLIKNQKGNSNYHSKWLSMMYSRLMVSKGLLREDGVIFISIDDNEITNLRKICDEIFGEENFGTSFIWEKGKEGGNDSSLMRSHYEHILMYVKNINMKEIINLDAKDTTRHIEKLPEENLVEGIENEERLGELFQLINLSKQKDYQYNIKLKNGEVISWKGYLSPKTFNEYIKKGRIFVGERRIPYVKSFLADELSGQKPSNLLGQKFGTTKSGTKEVKDLIGEKVFTYPKPSSLIERFISIGTKPNDIIIDFFSGSASTAHAVMKYNIRDNGNRKYIMIQLPEITDEKSEAYKAGYKNICEIGKERIRRAGDKILEENKDKEGIENLDIGFKVFRVENSNIRWENQLEEDGQIRYDLDGKNIDDIDFIPGTKDIDVVYEILLRHYGIPLTAKIEKLDFIGNRTYTIQGSIIVCLETQITKEIVDKISELEPVKVIFRDSAFGDDISLKQNSVHRLNVLIEKNNKNTTHVVEFI